MRASALIYNPALSESAEAQTAGSLIIEIEHFTGHNVTMTVAYHKAASGLVFLAPIVSEGAYRVLPRRTG